MPKYRKLINVLYVKFPYEDEYTRYDDGMIDEDPSNNGRMSIWQSNEQVAELWPGECSWYMKKG